MILIITKFSIKSSKWKYWKDLCDATTSQTKNASEAKLFKDVWIHFNDMVYFMRKSQIHKEDEDCFKSATKNFINSIVKAWGESHITHYMVSTDIDVYYIVICHVNEFLYFIYFSHIILIAITFAAYIIYSWHMVHETIWES